MSILPGFTEGWSDNLPKIDNMSMFSFLSNNPDFMGAENQVKRSRNENYGDDAVGHVQVKRDSNFCTVKAEITLCQKAYNVTLLYNEDDEEVISINCDGCTALLGGCKHAIVLLTWLHRHSEEPDLSSASCYGKEPELSTNGETPKYIKAKDFGRNVKPLPPRDGSFLNAVVEYAKREGFYDTVLLKYFKEPEDVELISIHRLSLNFFRGQHGSTGDDFLNYCCSHVSDAVCSDAANKTVLQRENSLWHELRYGRITASEAYEIVHCETLEEYLINDILGPVVSLKDSAAMKKSKKLKKAVRKEIEREKDIKINLCGFHTSAKYPVIGASPDGISDDYVIEIKCPTVVKGVTHYIKNDEVKEKYKAQIQLQMFFCQKKQGLFCVADADFEQSKKLSIIIVEYDEQYCLDILEKCNTFWKKSVFPVLNESLN